MKILKVLIVGLGILFAQGQIFADSNNSLDQMVASEFQSYEMADAQSFNSGLNYIAMSEGEIESNMWLGAGLNFFVGFGLGSFIQGDITPGIVGAAANVIGAGAIIAGIIVGGNGIFQALGGGGDQAVQTGVTLFFVGAIVVGASRVYGAIMPFLYADAQRSGNASLMRKNKNVNFMFAPKVRTDQVTLATEFEGVTAGASLRF